LGIPPKKRRTPFFGIKNEEHHENVAKIPEILGIPPKKEMNTIFWVSKLKRAIRNG
jgi:hypothetical protein